MSTMRNSIGLVLGTVALSTVMSCGGGGGGGAPAPNPTPNPNPNPNALSITKIEQDRNVDPTGATAVFYFNRALEAASATAVANYVASAGQLALVATLAASGTEVVVSFDSLILPGSTSFSVSEVVDSTGQKMAAAAGLAVGSTDTTPPSVTSSSATAVANAFNDVVSLVFDDQMVASDLLNPANLTPENPVGNVIALGSSTLSYDQGTRTLTLTLDNQSVPANLEFGLGWQLSASNVRDIGGNSAGSAPIASGTVAGDNTAPFILGVTQNTAIDPLGHTVDIAFSEIVDTNTALSTFNYVANYVGGPGNPLLAVPVGNGDTVRVTFPQPVVPGQETVDVQSVEDLAGNEMTASLAIATSPDDAIGPQIASVSVAAVSGIFNDTVTISFDEQVLLSGAQDLSNYSLQSPVGNAIAFGAGTQLLYDQNSRTATLVLSSMSVETNLQTGADFLLSLSNIRDVAGNALQSGPQSGVVTGDATGPQIINPGVLQKTSVNPTGSTVDVSFDEAVSKAAGENAANYTSDGGQTALWSVLVNNGATARVTFDSAVPAGATVTVNNIQDLAGNSMVSTANTVVADETLPPSILSIVANAPANAQNDTITVAFDEAMLPSAALNPANFAVESPPGTPITLDALSVITYNAATYTTNIVLSSPVNPANLQVSGGFKVTVNNLTDVAGNAIPAASNSVTGTVSGDTAPPTIANVTMVPTLTKILEIEFSEQLDPASVATATWTFSQFLQTSAPGAASLNSDGKTVRLVATFGNSAGQTIDVTGIKDLAGNVIDVLSPPATIQ